MGKEKDKPKVTLFGNSVHKIKISGVYFALDVRIKEHMNYKEIRSKIKSPFNENIRFIKI